MKKLILPILLLILCPIVNAQEKKDLLDNMSMIIAKSDNMEIFSNNSANFRNDRGRLGRNSLKQGYVVYEAEGIKEVKVTAYSDIVIDKDVIKFYTSEDNENFSETEMFRSYNGTAKVGYQAYDLVFVVPENAKYFKIEWQGNKRYSSLPQISEISFSDKADVYDKKGLLLYEPFKDKSLMYDVGGNFRFEIGGAGPNNMFDNDRLLRAYDIKSAVKYKIKNPMNLKLRYFVMDGKGEVEIFASSYDGGYKEVPSQKTFPEHMGGNWSVVYLTADDFPEGTEFIQLVCPTNNHVVWPPVLSEMEVRY